MFRCQNKRQNHSKTIPNSESDGTLTLVKDHALWGDNKGGNTVLMGPVTSASETYTGELYANMGAMHVNMLIGKNNHQRLSQNGERHIRPLGKPGGLSIPSVAVRSDN